MTFLEIEPYLRRTMPLALACLCGTAAVTPALGQHGSDPAHVGAQHAQPTPRPLGPPIATSVSRIFFEGSTETEIVARELADGQVLVLRGDAVPVILEHALAEWRTLGRVDYGVLPPTIGSRYGERPLPQVWFGPGDTTLLSWWIGSTFTVIDPDGRIVNRARAIRVPSGVNLFAAGPRGGRLDPRGRFLIPSMLASGSRDSAALVWVGFDGRHEQSGVTVLTGRVWGGFAGGITSIDLNDSWVALPDGGVFVMRTMSCAIEFVSSGGVRTSYPPLPCPGRIPTGAETQRRLALADVAGVPMSSGFEPAYVPSLALGDPDGRVWIVRNPFLQPDPFGGRIYDVVDRSGRIVDSVIIPPAHRLAGLGRGVVYLVNFDTGKLERVGMR